jgi:acyl-[acyl-carrier-protein]-phospholipid O-acyltransferase/long-chain-fatty-acid--[acyl-carrier-protein] ligase
MQGYLADPQKTAAVIHEGWYDTGDLARIDDDGFLTICGRLSGFSKIGGEMVPHAAIEEALLAIVSDDSLQAEPRLVVTGIPDESRGERIVVVHLPFAKPLSDVIDALLKTSLPRLWLPSVDSFFEVSQIPMLGTGKPDLMEIRRLATGSPCD